MRPMNPPTPETIQGFAHRHDNWHETTAVSSIGRRTMGAVPSYRLLKAATQIEATAAARLLLVHLIGYLGQDDEKRPDSRFVVFPGNDRLSDELHFTTRSIQRQADELESKGMLRRCYNGMNRRTGFDLTPFAMQHEAVMADVCAVQTRRKQDRALSQMELSLEADRISRPSNATQASSQGDADVTHNRTDIPDSDGSEAAAAALDAFDWRAAAYAGKHLSVEQDRTQDEMDETLRSITGHFTGGGRASNLGWSAALNSLGRDRAVALYLVAESDPRRKASPERYFGWLLRMSATGDGHDAVVEAAKRAGAAAAKRKASAGNVAASIEAMPMRMSTVTASDIKDVSSPGTDMVGNDNSAIVAEAGSVPQTGGDDRVMPDRESLAGELRSRVGERLYDGWLGKSRIETDSDGVLVTAPNPFVASWIEKNMIGKIEEAASELAGRRMDVRIRTAA
jgi:hypothetical protein